MIHDMCVHPEKSSKILTFNLHPAQVLALIRTAAVLQGNVPGYSARHSSPHRHWCFGFDSFEVALPWPMKFHEVRPGLCDAFSHNLVRLLVN